MRLHQLNLEVSIHKTVTIPSSVSGQRGPQKEPENLGCYGETTDGADFNSAWGRVFASPFAPFYIDLQGIARGEAAVLISVQNVNSRTGLPAFKEMSQTPQNYYVDAPWVDGWTVRSGVVRQFIFVPDGSGLEVAEYLLPECLMGNKIAIAVFRPDPRYLSQYAGSKGGKVRGGETFGGVGAAGEIHQYHQIDRHPLAYWKTAPSATFTYDIVFPDRRYPPVPKRDDGFLKNVPPAA